MRCCHLINHRFLNLPEIIIIIIFFLPAIFKLMKYGFILRDLLGIAHGEVIVGEVIVVYCMYSS